MRLFQRGRVTVLCQGKEFRAAQRPLSGALSARLYGEYVQDMLRLLLPCGAPIAPGARAEINGAPYVCVSTRPYPGHLAADLRRCAK